MPNLTDVLNGEDEPTIEAIIRALNLVEFDLGQTWTNVTSSRALSVTYTNNTGKPIELIIALLSNSGVKGAANFSINGVFVSSKAINISANAGQHWFAFDGVTIPDGDTYIITSSSATIQTWFELR